MLQLLSLLMAHIPLLHSFAYTFNRFIHIQGPISKKRVRISVLFPSVRTVYEKIFHNDAPNGMVTTIILLCVFGGIQLFCVGIIGEYVGQVYREVKARPRYIKETELK